MNPTQEPRECTVIVIVPDRDLCDALMEAVQSAGGVPCAAPDATTALEALRRAPPPRLVLVDVGMGQAKSIVDELDSEALKSVNVIAISSRPVRETEIERFAKVLIKPFDLDEVGEVLTEHCA